MARWPERNGDPQAQGMGDTQYGLGFTWTVAVSGFLVEGSDGSLWLGPKREIRSTHQTYSVWQTGWYHAHRGEEVLMPLVPGAMAQFEGRFAADGKPDGVVRGRG
jgi:hypothetical protein